ncbi:hypothetical protein EJ07DRAFT_81873, partial [Lizonia empirigonia]
LMNGGMSEAQARSAHIHDVDQETFVRFLEYAYLGNYTTPPWTADPKIARDRPTLNPDVSAQLDLGSESDPDNAECLHIAAKLSSTMTDKPSSGWSNSSAAPSDFGAMVDPFTKVVPSKAQNIKERSLRLRSVLEKHDYSGPYNSRNLPSQLPNDFPECGLSRRNFTPIFLAHARLYTFADMRMVQPLKIQVLGKLLSVLERFEPFPERIGDVLELAKHAYEHGEDVSEDGRMDALRELVMNYIVCEKGVVKEHAEFRVMMRESGEFARGFW